jgi:RNA polymerase sigma-70 factor, ECF subfamily
MDDITLLLADAAAGRRDSQEKLLDLVYGELHRLASVQMKHEFRKDHTLQPTALVNEAYVRLIGTHEASWQSRGHFYNAAAQTMRRILVDYARSRLASKRPNSGDKIDFSESISIFERPPEETLALNDALNRLEQLDARQCNVVVLRFFTGLSVEETAATLGISEKTVKRDWALARAWLQKELTAA